MTFVFVVSALQFTFKRRLCSILPLVSDVEVCASPLVSVRFCLASFLRSLSDVGCARSSRWLADAEVCASPLVICSRIGSVGVEVELRSLRFHIKLQLQIHIVYGALWVGLFGFWH